MIVITTPNGKVGREVAAQLLARGAPVRLAAHTPERARSAFEGATGAEIVPFEYGDDDAVRAAVGGATALYLASPGAMSADPVQRAVDLAVEAGVERIVRLSAMGVEEGDSPLRRVELHIEEAGVDWTHLRPNWFMQNYSTSMAASIRDEGVFREPAGDAATGFVDARDIAAVAVAALTDAGHAGEGYPITGPAARTRSEVADAISAALGRPVRYEAVDEESFQEGMRASGAPDDYVRLMTELYRAVRAGSTAAVTDAVERATGRAPRSLEQFAADHAGAWR